MMLVKKNKKEKKTILHVYYPYIHGYDFFFFFFFRHQNPLFERKFDLQSCWEARSKFLYLVINQSNFTSQYQNRKLPTLFPKFSPRGSSATGHDPGSTCANPILSFCRRLLSSPSSQRKEEAEGARGGRRLSPGSDSRVGNYSFRGEGGEEGECSNSKAGHHLPYLFIPRCRLLAGWVSANANGIAS